VTALRLREIAAHWGVLGDDEPRTQEIERTSQDCRITRLDLFGLLPNTGGHQSVRSLALGPVHVLRSAALQVLYDDNGLATLREALDFARRTTLISVVKEA
jgi:hypothetical protein